MQAESRRALLKLYVPWVDLQHYEAGKDLLVSMYVCPRINCSPITYDLALVLEIVTRWPRVFFDLAVLLLLPLSRSQLC